jgi:hypothetical protein
MFALGLAGCVLLVVFASYLKNNRLSSVLAVSVPLVLFVCVIQTINPSVGKEGEDSAFNRIGALRIILFGVSLPTDQQIVFGENKPTETISPTKQEKNGKVFFNVPNVPPQLAQIENHEITPANALDSGGLYVAKVIQDSHAFMGYDSYRLKQGAKLCVAHSGEKDCSKSDYWQYSDNQLLFFDSENSASGGKATCHFPRQRFAWLTSATTSNQIYPLANYGRVGCKGAAVAPLDYRDETTAFVFFQYDKEGQLLVSEIKNKSVAQNRLVVEGVPAQPKNKVTLNPINDSTLEFYRVHLADPRREGVEFRWNGSDLVEHGSSQLHLLRRFKINFASPEQTDSKRIFIKPETPSVQEIAAEKSCFLNDDEGIDLLGWAENNTGLEVKIPFVSDLSEIGAQGAKIAVHRTSSENRGMGCSGVSRAKFSVLGPMGEIKDLKGGELFSIGDSNATKLLLSISEVQIPWEALLYLMLGVTLVRIVIRDLSVIKLSSWAICAVALIDILLIIRLTSSMQEITLNSKDGNIVKLAILVLIVVPIVIEIGIAIFNNLSGMKKSIHADTWIGRACKKVHIFEFGFLRNWRWVFILWIIPVMHIAYVFVGGKEQFFNFRVSMIFVPLYALAISFYIFNSILTRNNWVGSVFLALTAFAFISASDTGAILCFLTGPLLFMGYIAIKREPESNPTQISNWNILLGLFSLSLPALLYVLALFYLNTGNGDTALGLSSIVIEIFMEPAFVGLECILGVGLAVIVFYRRAELSWRLWSFLPTIVILSFLTMSAWGGMIYNTPPCEESDSQSCPQKDALKTNQLRVALMLCPECIDSGYSRESRGMLQVFEELDWLTDTWAKNDNGFMNIPPRQSLDMHDNASAVHIIGPFGKSAAYLLLFIFSAFALYTWRLAHARKYTFGAVCTSVCVSVFCFSSTYILMANMQWVFFTGRNVYLTNALSTSDLIEGLVLLLMAFLTAPFRAFTTGEQS